jgi:2-oxoglutarate dehydrogenase E2 component (dihydrolipoamide succinyltransferase)
LPYPNLADVPAATQATPAGAQEAIAAQAQTGISAPSPGALAGLTLPAAAPPVPNVPGLSLTAPVAPAPAPAPVAAPAPKPPGPPQGVAFRPGSALLPPEQAKLLKTFAAQRAGAQIRVVGFGEGNLPLAVSRARRIADALTADGVPSADIHVAAQASGSGGFAQLVY